LVKAYPHQSKRNSNIPVVYLQQRAHSVS
jgi:hypothetical protein